ncbi:hypothetical protein E4U54_007915 [Claviceps lovelessii]|nr:hypothetical protein E4U54_007915 [Claviceps lovelessii]
MLVHPAYPPNHLQLPVMTTKTSMEASSKPRLQPAQSQPVDPQELSRRLSVVLAEQKARSDRKRRQSRTDAVAIKLEQHSLNSRPNRNDDRPLSTNAGRMKTGIGMTHKMEHPASYQRTSLDHLSPKKPSTSSTQNVQDELENNYTYRHIPKVAAAQFTSTTTAESTCEKGPIHVLSRQAMRFHLDGPNATLAAKLNESDAPCEKNKALKRAQSMRERHYKRNPIDKTTLPLTSELDMALYPLKPCCMHQDETKSNKLAEEESRDARRMSTGSMLGRPEARAVEPFDLVAAVLSPEKSELVGHNKQHRVDWTQSDEPTMANGVVQPIPTRSELRKTESKWKLRGRLGGLGRHHKEDKLLTPPEETIALDAAPKFPITGFLSRFKR